MQETPDKYIRNGKLCRNDELILVSTEQYRK